MREAFREVQCIGINMRDHTDFRLTVQVRAGMQSRRAPGTMSYPTLKAARAARDRAAKIIGCKAA